jgi:putative ABC transport system permease protein
MILNYLKVALRHLRKNKIYLLINILGMGIAISCAMTSYLLIAYNVEFDATIDKERVKNIVKVVHHRTDTDNDPYMELAAPLPLLPSAAAEISGIKSYSRFGSTGGYLSYRQAGLGQNDKGFHETIFFADTAFMSMFQPTLIRGSYKNFHDKNSIFLNEKFATKYFGDEDPIGKEITIYSNNKTLIAIVGGVMKDAPFNSTFVENVLMPFENYLDIQNRNDNDWANNDKSSALLELNDISQASTVATAMNKYVIVRNQAEREARSVRYELLPFMYVLSPNDVRSSDLHLRIPNIALFIFITLGGIILLIACFNLTNTMLALSAKRLKEIGIRKALGSERRKIVAQFLFEIMFTISMAVVVGFALALFLIPEFSSMWQLPYGLKELNGINIVIALLVLLFATSLLAGIYPAFVSSKQSPLLLFRGTAKVGGTNIFIRSLLVGQFALSIVVLIGGTMFSRNAEYQDNLSFGYDKDRIITALIQGPKEAEALDNAILANPKIESVAASTHHFAFVNAPKRNVKIAGEDFNASVYEISAEYFSTVGLQFVSGRSFGEKDSTSVVVDENFVRRRNLSDPLGTKVEIEGQQFSIAGVVTNHLTDLESRTDEYFVYRLAKPASYQILVVRADAKDLAGIKDYIDSEWKKLFPGKPLRTDLQRDILYEEANGYNHNLGKIFIFLTVLGCLLSVSGLYAMASLNIHRRTKEIGIRKVLGASISSILRLINKEFAIILLIAGILGGIGGFMLSDGLLSSLYKQRIEVGAISVVVCSTFVIVVGLTATSVTIWAAARDNPVKALKES